MTATRKERPCRTGVVVSNKMDKTVTVSVETTLKHPRYSKVVKRTKKYYAHTDKELSIGAKVKISSTRPLSKTKRWRVVEEAN